MPGYYSRYVICEGTVCNTVDDDDDDYGDYGDGERIMVEECVFGYA